VATFLANKKLQLKLRTMIECDGLTEVARQLHMGREPLARYLADLHLHTSTFRGIEAGIAAAHFDPLPLRKARTPQPRGLGSPPKASTDDVTPPTDPNPVSGR
jgi:hypothetical protein